MTDGSESKHAIDDLAKNLNDMMLPLQRRRQNS